MDTPEHTPQQNALVAAFGIDQPLTMSSREIAELCEKRHDHVMRDIKKMLDGLGEDAPKFGEVSLDAYGRHQPGYRLPKDLTLTLVAGYNVRLRKRIIDRWLELEGGPQSRPMLDFADPRVMLGVFQHLQTQVAEKDGVIAEQGQRLKKLDRLEGAKGSMCISDAAKTLGVKRDYLFQFMSARRWIYKRAGGKTWLAYDEKRNRGLLEHDDFMKVNDAGEERVYTRVLVTAKGLVKLSELLEQPLN